MKNLKRFTPIAIWLILVFTVGSRPPLMPYYNEIIIPIVKKTLARIPASPAENPPGPKRPSGQAPLPAPAAPQDKPASAPPKKPAFSLKERIRPYARRAIEYAKRIARRVLLLLLDTTFVTRAGHFFLYSLGGVTFATVIALDTGHERRRKSRIARFLETLLAGLSLAAVVAAADEIHQAFVPGRGSEFGDFRADMYGFMTGMALVVIHSLARSRPGNGRAEDPAKKA